MVKFKLKLSSTENCRNLLQNTTARIFFNGKTSDFKGLTSKISLGEPQPLPNKQLPSDLTPGIAQSFPSKPSPPEINTNVKLRNCEEEGIIDRTNEFFPEPGNYQVQFFLGQRASNIVNLAISQPNGINREAYEFLRKFEDGSSFNWVWKGRKGVTQLENFVTRYGQSVYGESAIEKLASIYLVRGELDKSQTEYEKIKSSRNPVLNKEANKSLVDIARRKARLNQPKRPQ